MKRKNVWNTVVALTLATALSGTEVCAASYNTDLEDAAGTVAAEEEYAAETDSQDDFTEEDVTTEGASGEEKIDGSEETNIEEVEEETTESEEAIEDEALTESETVPEEEAEEDEAEEVEAEEVETEEVESEAVEEAAEEEAEEPETVESEQEDDSTAVLEVVSDESEVLDAAYSGGTYSGEFEITENTVIDGDVHFEETVRLNGYRLIVNGNVTADAEVKLDGGFLQVAGDYVQTQNALSYGGGQVRIEGDLRLQGIDEEGNYTEGSGCALGDSDSSMIVDGDVIVQSTYQSGVTIQGSLDVKGDIVQLETSKNVPFKIYNLDMDGEKTQSVTLLEKSSIVSLTQTNPNPIEWNGYMQAELSSDVSITVPEGTVSTTLLRLNGHKLTVAGSIVASGGVKVGNGILEVEQDYTQTSFYLSYSAGATMTIGGDLRFQGLDGAGSGYVEGASGATMTVKGDLIMDSTHITSFPGTLTVYGDITQLSVPDKAQLTIYDLNLNGDAKQTVTLLETSTIKKLVQTNQKVAWIGYLNGALDTDVKVSLPEGTLYTTSLNMNNHNLTASGRMVAEGSVQAGTGTLKVTGDYVQTKNYLSYAKGNIKIGGNLRFQGISPSGSYTSGTGMVHYVSGCDDASLSVAGNLMIQSSTSFSIYGKLTLKGSLAQLKTSGTTPSVTIRNLVLSGSSKQKVEFANSKSKITQLKLSKDISNYSFSPNPCWSTLLSNSVSLKKSSVTVKKGTPVSLTATKKPAQSTDTLTWKSSNTKVATVNSLGVVTGKKAGTAKITVTTSSGKKATCKVTVKVPATKVTLNKKTATVKKGKTLKLKGTMSPSGTTDKLTWKSSNTKIATVNSKTGVVTGKKAGTVTITATATSGKKATCKVTVQ